MMWPKTVELNAAIIVVFPSLNHLYCEEFAEITKVKEQIILSSWQLLRIACRDKK